MSKFVNPWMDPNLPPIQPLDASELMQVRIYQLMTPYQRWEQAAGLREMAGRLKKAALKRSHPDWSEAELDAAVLEFFLRAHT
jgi:Rv0078B-related antitoxin